MWSGHILLLCFQPVFIRIIFLVFPLFLASFPDKIAFFDTFVQLPDHTFRIAKEIFIAYSLLKLLRNSLVWLGGGSDYKKLRGSVM